MPSVISGLQGQVMEWSYESGIACVDPFNDMELDVVVQHVEGKSWRVPAYWAGDREWRVRFAPPMPGRYEVETASTGRAGCDLGGRRATVEVAAHEGQGALLTRGPLRVAASGRSFEHADGTPLLWLGDTWWMGLCARLSWPADFQTLTADRVAKGFNVIQIVAGLYPDMPAFDPRGANEAGFPWEPDWGRINPAYFDMADLRMAWLVREGLIPCIVGGWGYYLPLLGIRKMKQHWRYLIARWAALPVVWCVAGEATMPYYLSEDKAGDAAMQRAGWTEIARYVRQIDPYGRLITAHPTEIGRDQVEDDSVLDFDMLQTGHGGHESVPNTVKCVCAERKREPRMPVLVGEVSYEGILHHCAAEVQRLHFWAAMLCGAAGHTYGANGIWQFNTRRQPYGPSPHGGTWGDTPWEDACQLPGSAHLGLARSLLERFEWWRFEPHPEWVEPAAGAENVGAPFAAGIPGSVRIIYLYDPIAPWTARIPHVTGFEPGSAYEARFWDPAGGAEHPIGPVAPGSDGRWPIPCAPVFRDWVIVMENQRGP